MTISELKAELIPQEKAAERLNQAGRELRALEVKLSATSPRSAEYSETESLLVEKRLERDRLQARYDSELDSYDALLAERKRQMSAENAEWELRRCEALYAMEKRVAERDEERRKAARK